MKHCHISIQYNELPFLKQKIPFLYKHFDQIILIDNNINTNENSNDGSIEYIENFNDPEKKIYLIKDIDYDKIKKYRGYSYVKKRKMFGLGSQYIRDEIDVVWSSDLDEFFKEELISVVEKLLKKDKSIQTIKILHKMFVFNEHNVIPIDFCDMPRITRHRKNFIYGHCDFQDYGKNYLLKNHYIYHYNLVGLKRNLFKFRLYSDHSRFNYKKWIKIYYINLIKNKKYIKIPYHNLINNRLCFTVEFTGSHPKYINLRKMCEELNNLDGFDIKDV